MQILAGAETANTSPRRVAPSLSAQHTAGLQIPTCLGKLALAHVVVVVVHGGRKEGLALLVHVLASKGHAVGKVEQLAEGRFLLVVLVHSHRLQTLRRHKESQPGLLA